MAKTIQIHDGTTRPIVELDDTYPGGHRMVVHDDAGGGGGGGGDASEATLATRLSEADFDEKVGEVDETAPASDTASSGLNGRLQRIAQRLTSLIALFPTSLGTKTAANSFPVALSSDGTFATLSGAVNETAPASDTAASGLNGRLQRIAQRLTSLIALLPSALVSGRLDVNLGAAPAVVSALAGGYAKKPSATFTRPANTDPYTAEDEVATASTAPTAITVARANDGTGWITGGRLLYSNSPTVTPDFRVYLFTSTVTLAGDNAAIAISDADALKCIGILETAKVNRFAAGTSGAQMHSLVPASGTPIAFECSGGVATLFACIKTTIGFTPIANSETLTLALDVDRD